MNDLQSVDNKNPTLWRALFCLTRLLNIGFALSMLSWYGSFSESAYQSCFVFFVLPEIIISIVVFMTCVVCRCSKILTFLIVFSLYQMPVLLLMQIVGIIQNPYVSARIYSSSQSHFLFISIFVFSYVFQIFSIFVTFKLRKLNLYEQAREWLEKDHVAAPLLQEFLKTRDPLTGNKILILGKDSLSKAAYTRLTNIVTDIQNRFTPLSPVES